MTHRSESPAHRIRRPGSAIEKVPISTATRCCAEEIGTDRSNYHRGLFYHGSGALPTRLPQSNSMKQVGGSTRRYVAERRTRVCLSPLATDRVMSSRTESITSLAAMVLS